MPLLFDVTASGCIAGRAPALVSGVVGEGRVRPGPQVKEPAP